jgi:hypothetical protein
MAVDTRKVRERRVLHFASFGELLSEIDRLERCSAVRCLGNWSAGQNFSHLARAMVASIDGFPGQFPWPVRMIGKMIKPVALRRRMPTGFRMPKRIHAAMVPDEKTLAEGAADLRRAIGRLRSETRRSPSPLLGELSAAEWEQFHCRHAELHLGFLVPVDNP